MSKTKKQKYILSLIGTIIYQIGMGSITIMGFLNVYITSYIQLNQKWITMHYGLFLQPILTFCITCVSPIGGLIEKKIGFYYSLILSNIIFLIGLFGLYLTQNIWLCYFFFFIIGSSCFSLRIPVKNILFYVPEKKGFISSVITVVMSISSSIFGFIGESVINKDNYTLKEKETFYPKYICENIYKFYIIQMICVPIFTFFSFLFIYIYDSSFENENEIEKLISNSLYEENKKKEENKITEQDKITSKISNNEKDENDEEEKKKKEEKYKKDIKKAIKSKQFWLLCGIAFCVSFLIRFVLLTFRTFGALIGMSGETFKYLGIIISLSIIIFTPIWGYLVDKFGAKIILKITSFLCFISGVFLSLTINYTSIFSLFIAICIIILSGFMSAIRPYSMEIFSIKYTIEIGGLILFFPGLSGIICTIISFIVSFYYTTGEELKTPYRVIYIIGSILGLIGFILNYCESGEKFNFDEEEVIIENKDIKNDINNSDISMTNI